MKEALPVYISPTVLQTLIVNHSHYIYRESLSTILLNNFNNITLHFTYPYITHIVTTSFVLHELCMTFYYNNMSTQ